MMNLVVDRVLNHPDARALPLTECGVLLLEAMRRNCLPHAIQLRFLLVPATENLVAGLRLRSFRPLTPLSGGNAVGDRHRHAEHLARELCKRPHAADRILEQFLLRECLYHLPRHAAMSLPVFEELL